MRSWLMVVGVPLFSACFTPVAEVECTKDSDCAPWFSCVERRCVTPVDAGRGVDAGVVRDAGASVGSCEGAGPATSWGNAATELTGAQLGGGTPSAPLTHPLTVTLTTDLGLELVNAQVSRSRANTETSYVAIRVKNTSRAGACFIRADEFTYHSAGGEVVSVDAVGGFVHGSVATMTASQIATDTCLLPGEEGFLVDIVLERDASQFFSRTAGVRLRLDSLGSDFIPQRATYLPRSYTAVAASIGRTVSVVARNEGPGRIELDGSRQFSMLIPLDEEGRGLPWAYLETSASGVIKLGPCETVTLREETYLFDGSASRAYARTGSFSACTGCARAWDLSTDEGRAAFLDQRNAVEADKRRALAP
ncbi:MAG: hypothetical protein ACOZQL_07770 [Myxococcota bacterium]